jgi:hypothetical protein
MVPTAMAQKETFNEEASRSPLLRSAVREAQGQIRYHQ